MSQPDDSRPVAIVQGPLEASVRDLFGRYERSFDRALQGDIDLKEVATFYAEEFIAASPAGVMAGKNDEALKTAMTNGYARYRAIGTKAMHIRHLTCSPIDEHHFIAHVAWSATYARMDLPEVRIDFDVHYLVQKLDSEPKIFGWISGDEQAALRERGIV